MKKLRNLSLVLAGFALGVTVAYAPQIQAAANNLLGSKVGNVLNVKINNKSIGSGAVINGTTYVPIRAAANAMGMEVAKVDSKEVLIVTSDVQPTADDIQKENDKAVLTNKINGLKTVIKSSQDEINTLTDQVAELKVKADNDTSTVGTAKTQYNIFNKSLEEKKNELADQQKQLADLESQLEALR